VGGDPFAFVRTSREHPDRRRVAQVMEPQPPPVGLVRQSCSGAEALKQPTDGGVAEPGPASRDEEVVIVTDYALTALQVTS
jgi:hypothetical protein